MEQREQQEVEHIEQQALEAQLNNNLDEAMRYYQQIVKLRPGSALSYVNMATISILQGNFHGAIVCDEIALSLAPNSAEIHNHLGIAYQKAGREDEAKAQFEQALAINPEDAFTLCNIASLNTNDLLMAKELLFKAFKPLLRQFEENPQEKLFYSEIQANAVINYVNVCLEICDFKNATHVLPLLELITTEQARDNFQTSIPPQLAELLLSDQQLITKVARSHANARLIDPAKKFTTYEIKPGKLKVAYIYNGFDNLVYDSSFEQILMQHDKDNFQVGVVITAQVSPEFIEAIETKVDFVLNLAQESYFNAAQSIHTNAIAILIDSTGYGLNSKMEVLAYKPAPIQVNYLGHIGTTGASYMDYVFADESLIPTEQNNLYNESIVKLPTSFVFDKFNESSKEYTRQQFGLPLDKIVFANFSPALTINQELLKAWVAILTAVEDSVLFLLHSSDYAQNNLLQQFIEHRIDPERIIFTKHNINQEPFIHGVADVYLDGFMENNDLQIISSIICKVAPICLEGAKPITRIAKSVLSAGELTQLLVDSPQAYIQAAIDYSVLAKRQEFSKMATQSINCSALFNVKSFVSNLEKAYTQIWQAYTN